MFLSDRFSYLSASFLAGYQRWTKKDTVFAATNDAGLDTDISQYGDGHPVLSSSGESQYEPSVYTSGSNIRCNVPLRDVGDGMTIDCLTIISSSTREKVIFQFIPTIESGNEGWGFSWGGGWSYGGSTGSAGNPLYSAILDGDQIEFEYNNTLVRRIDLPSDSPSTAFTCSIHWAMRVNPVTGSSSVYDTTATQNQILHEIMIVNHATNVISRSVGAMSYWPYTDNTGTLIFSNQYPEIQAIRVSNAYHPQREHYYDYISGAINDDVNPGDGEYDYDYPLIPVQMDNAGEYFGPVPAASMLHVERAYRKMITPLQVFALDPPRFDWANFTSDDDELIFDIASSSFGTATTGVYRSHRGWNQRYKLPVYSPVNTLRVQAFATVSGTVHFRIGSRTHMPFENPIIGQQEIYYATGTITDATGSVEGVVPIARHNDQTVVYVAVSGSTSAATFEIHGFTAMPQQASSSAGILQGGIGGLMQG